MEIQRRLAFREESEPQIMVYLKEQDIPFKESIFIIVEILESDPRWPGLYELIKEKQPCPSETLFTKKELQSAEWLRVRSRWLCGYPQPEAAFGYCKNITYADDNHCPGCGGILKQIAPFRLKKAPSWGKRHFMMLNWVADELFVSEAAKQILEQEALTGIGFYEVHDKKGMDVLPGISQLVISNTLDAGLVTDRRTIDQINHCDSCGTTLYHSNGAGMMAFKRSIFENAPDFVKTSERFGWGKYYPQHIVVSHRAYEIITRNHLERGLVFEPIELV